MVGTIADKLTALNETKTAIKDAIVAKGVEVPDGTTFRDYADKISQIESGGGGLPFGIPADFFGALGADGTLSRSFDEFTLDLTGVKVIGKSALQYKYQSSYISNIIAPDLVRIEESGMFNGLLSNNNIRALTFPKLAFIGSNGCYYAFNGNARLAKVAMPNLTEIGERGAYYMFSGCSDLAEVNVSSLMKLGKNACANMFGLTKITTISFPALYSVEADSFGNSTYNYIFYNCKDLLEIHFNKAAQANIEAMTGYADKWGATNATIYFDL